MMAADRTEESIATADVARQAIARVLAARPDLPHALALRGLVAMATGRDLDEAAAGLDRARILVPGRDDYSYLEAALDIERSDYHAAREILGPMMSPRYPPAVRDRARSLMGQAVTLEKRAADAAARANVPAGIPGEAPAATAPSSPDASRESGGKRGVRPEFRLTQAGERRTEGMLERIDCSSGAVWLDVRVDGDVVRFTAARMDQIDFITYRESLRGPVRCAVRTPPDHVYVTWRPQPASVPGAVARRAVAVEFLPD
jgi:hypothetical protein